MNLCETLNTMRILIYNINVMGNETDSEKVLYHEVQKPPISLRLVVLLVSLPIFFATMRFLIFSGNFGHFPQRDYIMVIIGILVGFVLPVYYLRSVYEIELVDESIIIKTWPFNRIPRKIPLHNLYKYRSVSHMAVGFLSRVRQHKVYSGFGTTGVQLEFENRNQIYVGSQRPHKLVEAIDIALNKDVGKNIMMNLDRIQPTQAYINSDELARFIKDIQRPYVDYIGEVPIKKIGDHIVYIDKHTQAFAAYFLGLTEIKVKWANDDIDDAEYLKRASMCRKDGIHTIANLRTRIVSANDFKELWIRKTQN